MTPAWRSVPGYDGLYSLSSDGAIKSDRSGRMLAPVLNSDGYETIRLSRDGKSVRHIVHRLVCRAFHGEPEPGEQSAHLDGDRRNNHEQNLAWVTPKENAAHKILHGTHQAGEQHPQARLTAAQVVEIRKSRKSRAAIADEFGISPWTVKGIRCRARWQDASPVGSADVPKAKSPDPRDDGEK